MSNNKTIVQNYIEQMWVKRNFAAIDDYLAPNFVQHARGAPPGREGVKAFFAMINSAFSDLNYSIEDMIAESDKVCWRWEMRGKHTGVFQGIPATGKSIAVTGMSIIRLIDGRFVEHWGEQDMLGLLQQLQG